MGNFIQATAPTGTAVYAILYDPNTGTYYRPSTGAWVAFVSQTAHALPATFIRASRYLINLSGLGVDRLDIDARIYTRAGGVGAEATTDTEIGRAAFDWRAGCSYPIGGYSPPELATFDLGQDGTDVVLNGILRGNLPSDFEALAGLILTHPSYRAAWRVQSYDDGSAILVAAPLGHSITLFSAVGVATQGWVLSRDPLLPETAPAGYGGSTQLRVGGGNLSPVASGLDGSDQAFAADVLPLRFDLIGQDGQPISNVGATLTGTLTNAAGAVQASAVSISTTGLNVAEGELLATVTLPATVGTYQLTITRTASATDIQTFGPFRIVAQRK